MYSPVYGSLTVNMSGTPHYICLIAKISDNEFSLEFVIHRSIIFTKLIACLLLAGLVWGFPWLQLIKLIKYDDR